MRDKDEWYQQITRAGSLGARANRNKAEARYYANPPICLYCQQAIPLDLTQRITETFRKKFCNHSCAAKFTNAQRPNRGRAIYKCVVCDATISKRGKRCKTCSIVSSIDSMTKGEVFAKYGKATGAALIRGRSRQIVQTLRLPRKCSHCGYSLHVEVHHKRPIKSFDNDAPVTEINVLSNLIILCPNHHWEYEHGIIS